MSDRLYIQFCEGWNSQVIPFFFPRNFMCHRALIVCSGYELYIELENNFSCLYKFSQDFINAKVVRKYRHEH